MNVGSGLTTADAQLGICKGVLGRKNWSAKERQAACEKYEVLTGTRLNAGMEDRHQNLNTTTLLMVGMVVLFIVTTSILIFILLKKRPTLKQPKRARNQFNKKR